MHYEEFIKDKKIHNKTEEEEKNEIVLSIIRTKMELDNNRKNYEFAEGDLIDYYLYQIKANQSKLDHLIKTAKNKKVISDLIDQIKFDVI